ncbi:MAG: LLM class flavin-dependent oxidoreductase, partial [Desulfobacteraceae bacterium]|nr:LLM class flavin-dependent oxidoreductase [Desulfobacteraceae bacterium]
WTLLAAFAAQTSRIRIGQMVTGNTYRHPAVLANMGATVDVISNGRLDFGIGEGATRLELGGFTVSGKIDDALPKSDSLKKAEPRGAEGERKIEIPLPSDQGVVLLQVAECARPGLLVASPAQLQQVRGDDTLEEVFLELETVFVPGGGLINGLETVFFQNFTGFDGIAHNPLKLAFRKGYAVHPAPDCFQTFDQFLGILAQGGLDFGGDHKIFALKGFFQFHCCLLAGSDAGPKG